mgnify:CR=1 FL=1
MTCHSSYGGSFASLLTTDRYVCLVIQQPEILRTPLEHICLQIKLLGLDKGPIVRGSHPSQGGNKGGGVVTVGKPGSVARVLELALQPPESEAIVSAISTLKELFALTEEEELVNAYCNRVFDLHGTST